MKESDFLLKNIFKGMSFVFLGLTLGRLSGFIRESLIASKFGISSEADVIAFTLTCPDLLIDILIGGGLSAALIPEFKRLSIEIARLLFFRMSVLIGITFIILALIVIICKVWVIKLLAPGFQEESVLLMKELVSKVIWLTPLTALAGITTAYLQSQNLFGIAASGTLVFNIVVIFGLFYIANDIKDIHFLVWFILLGGAIRWFIQCLSLPRISPKTDFSLKEFFSGSIITNKFWSRYAYAIMGSGILLLYPVIGRAFASLNGEGGFVKFNYAFTLIKLPLGIAASVIPIVLFPTLSGLAFSKEDNQRFKKIISEGMLGNLLVSFIMFIPMSFFCRDFVSMAYDWGKMPELALDEVKNLFRIGLIILPLQVISTYLMMILNSLLDMRTTFIASTIGLICLFSIVNSLNIWCGNLGVMISIIIAYSVVMIWQIYRLRTLYNITILRTIFCVESLRHALIVIIVSLIFYNMRTMLAVSDGWNGILFALGSGLLGLMIALFFTEKYSHYICSFFKKIWKSLHDEVNVNHK